MAIKTVDWSLMAGAMLSEFLPEVYKQLLVVAPLLRYIKASQGLGATCNFDIAYEGTEAGEYADGDSTYADAVFGYNTPAKATLQWSNMVSGFNITEPAASKMESAREPAELINFWIGNKEATARRLVKRIASKIYNGTGAANSITGLGTAIDSAGVYAGINPAAPGMTNWYSYVNTTGGATRAFSIKMLDDLVRGIEKRTNGLKPDIIVTGTDIWYKIAQVLRPWRLDWSMLNAGMVQITSGVDALGYLNSIPIIKDPNCTDGCIYGLNTGFVELQYMRPSTLIPNSYVAIEPNVELKADTLTVGVQQNLNLLFALQILPVQGPVGRGVLLGHPQLCIKNRGSCGVVKDIDPAL